jgi:hypothetical protein
MVCLYLEAGFLLRKWNLSIWQTRVDLVVLSSRFRGFHDVTQVHRRDMHEPHSRPTRALSRDKIRSAAST